MIDNIVFPLGGDKVHLIVPEVMYSREDLGIVERRLLESRDLRLCLGSKLLICDLGMK